MLLTWVSGADPARLAVALGLALTGAGLLLALDGTRRLHTATGAQPSRIVLPGAVGVLLALPPVWDFATSGLETGLETFWLGLSWWMLVMSCSQPGAGVRRTRATAFVLGLGPLVRPDFVITSVLFLAVLWLPRPRPSGRRLAFEVVAAGLLPVGYEVFRMGYYGVLLPLPAITKESSASYWTRGWLYLQDFLGPFWLYRALPVLAVLLVVLLWQRRRIAERALIVAPVLAGLLMAFFVVKVGGDWMQARMLLPALFVLLLPVLVVPATRILGTLCLVLGVGAAVAASPLRGPYEPRLFFDANVRQTTQRLTGVTHPLTGADFDRAVPGYVQSVRLADAAGRPVLLLFGSTYGDDRLHPVALAAGRGSRPTFVGSYLGIGGAVVPLQDPLVDQLSLGYPLGAHLALQRGLWPGHEKMASNAWILADYAAPGAFPAGPHAPEITPAAVAAARHALSCGQLLELQQSVRQPLTLSRFLANIVGAPRRTTLRVPRDPFVAERQFCRTAKGH